MTAESILVINAGSSSIKYALYNKSDMALIARKNLAVKGQGAYEKAFEDILKLIPAHNVTGVGHRIVHGGKDYSAPVKIDDATFVELEKLTPLAPLHQPYNLKAVKLIKDAYPNLAQVASFDTAFHRTQPRLSQIYAIPRKMTDEGVIRYGFHGISYEYIASVLPPDVRKSRVIVAHLGSGASMCAMKDGKSVATTMGFTPLDGLMMGTRTGAIDPGIGQYLQEQKGMTAEQVTNVFNKESGLKGVSGTSNDMRELLAAGTKEANEAVDLFCLYAARQAASLSVDLGGVDHVVFTAGIGENSGPIRKKIMAHLAHLGPVGVHVIPTNEELMIAQHVKTALQGPAPCRKCGPAP